MSVKTRPPTETLPGQIDLEDRLRPYNVPLVPGQENQSRREHSVASLYLDEHGRELPNPTPMAPPIGYQKPISIAEQMRQMIRMASYEASMAGAETEEEANDFDVEEDMEPHSQWEHPFDPDPELEAMLALQSRAPSPDAPTPPSGVVPAKPEGRSSAVKTDGETLSTSHAEKRT